MSSQGRFYLETGRKPPEIAVIEIPTLLRKTFKRLPRDKNIFQLWMGGMNYAAIGKRFGLSMKAVSGVITRFPESTRKIEALEPNKRTGSLLKDRRFESTVYFNCCPRCRTGAVRLDWLPEHNCNLLWCINCGLEVAG